MSIREHLGCIHIKTLTEFGVRIGIVVAPWICIPTAIVDVVVVEQKTWALSDVAGPMITVSIAAWHAISSREMVELRLAHQWGRHAGHVYAHISRRVNVIVVVVKADHVQLVIVERRHFGCLGQRTPVSMSSNKS